MKKIVAMFILLILTGTACFASFSIISGSEAFTCYSSSGDFVFKMFKSSATLGHWSGTYASTITLAITNDTKWLGLFVSSADAQPYWTFTLSEGAYYFNPTTSSSLNDRIDVEGQSEGIQWDVTGKETSGSTSTPVAVYLQGCTTRSKYFDPNDRQYCVTMVYSTSTSGSNSIFLYQGETSTCTTNILTAPVSWSKDYPDNKDSRSAPNTEVDYALEFRVKHSTFGWTNYTTDDLLGDYGQIDYYIIK